MKFLGTIIKINDDGSLVLTDIPDDLTGIGIPANVLVGYSLATASPMRIINFEFIKNRLNVKLEKVESFERAKQLKEMGIFIEQELMLFDNDEGHFISDLVGCAVINIHSSEVLGKLTEVIKMPANDVWIVKTKDGELPIPAIKQVIKEIDLNNKKIFIEVIDGLLDLIE